MGPVLTDARRERLRGIAPTLAAAITPALWGAGPLDVEFGFEGERLWVLQARPLVSVEVIRGVGGVD